MSLVTGLFCLVLLLNQRLSPPLRLQVSHCSTFRIMCDVPSIAVFCSDSIECFPGTASKFLFRLLVTIPVAPIITGIIVHFRFIIIIIIIIIIIHNMFRSLLWPSPRRYTSWCHVFDCNYCTTTKYPTYARLYLLQYIYDVTAIETTFNSFITISGSK